MAEANIKIDSAFPGRIGTLKRTESSKPSEHKYRISIRNNVRRQDLLGQALITFITEGR
jgi:hypothetical protein